MNVATSSKVYDCVIVGSGAGGGTLSAHLASQGADVLVLEGGPKVNTRTDFNTHALPYEFPLRHIPTMKPGKPGFDGERSRGLGGKTQLWNAVALRFSERDFKGRSHDGAGEDWPFGYAEMKPYYDRIERQVGVCGNLDHLEDLPDGIFLPPVPLKCTDKAIQDGARTIGVNMIHVRKATLSRPMGTRPSCHFCGNCMSGCDVVAKYNSYDVHMIPALQTGRLTLQQNSIVYELAVSDEARVNGSSLLRSRDAGTGCRSGTRGRGCVCLRAERSSIADVAIEPVSQRPWEFKRRIGEKFHSTHYGWI